MRSARRESKGSPDPVRQLRQSSRAKILIGAVLLVLITAGVDYVPHRRSETDALAKETEAVAVPTVAVIQPTVRGRQ